MQSYQREFIRLAILSKALQFGEFTLKSGRVSPYFFNAGRFCTGSAIAKMGRFYAAALLDAKVAFDMVFGPAYKGIPLAAVTAGALADHHQRDLPYCYNRKEAKAHGEGGTLVGAPLEGNVAIIDDVITAGTAVREVLSIIERGGAKTSIIAVGLDRQERGQSERSAIDELTQATGVPVISIVTLDDILVFLESENQDNILLQKMHRYRLEYGVK